MFSVDTKSLIPYDGHFYKEVSEFIGGEGYFQYSFTKGTLQEVDWLVQYFNLPQRSRILDIGCGPGRHALELARRGYPTVGVDLSQSFINYAHRIARNEDVAAEFIMADARYLKLPQVFDAAISLCQGAFGLAGSDEDHMNVLRGINSALKPNGLLVLTVINVLNQVQQITNQHTFDPYTNTFVEEIELTNQSDERKSVDMYTTAFTYRELKLLLEAAHFQLVDAFGCAAGNFSDKPLSIHDTEIMVVARKIK